MGRSTINTIYRELCKTVIARLKAEWLDITDSRELEEHIKVLPCIVSFPQAVGALDGCHFAVSPPKENAAHYHNYEGWQVLPSVIFRHFHPLLWYA